MHIRVLIILSLAAIGQSSLAPLQATARAAGQAEQPPAAAKAGKDRKLAEQVFTPEGGAVSTSRLALPFKRAWQYLTDTAVALPATVDGSYIYLPLAGGRVDCLDKQTGSLIWASEFGGLINEPITAGETAVYIVTRKGSADGSEAGASLRAVDKATGLTLWARDYPRPFTSPLTISKGRIYSGSADGSFYALSIENGDVLWKVATQDVVRGRALVTEQAVYFGSDDGGVRGVEPATGREVWKFQTGGRVVGQPAIDKESIYFGSGDSFIYAVDLKAGKLRWRSRTGAAIEASPVIVGDRLLVASFDNFVYAVARANGNRVWKRRLDSRITAGPIIEGDATMVAPLRSDYVAVFLHADGRRVNFYRLERDSEIVADPVFSDNLLVLATNRGLIVASTGRQPDLRTNALRKQPDKTPR